MSKILLTNMQPLLLPLKDADSGRDPPDNHQGLLSSSDPDPGQDSQHKDTNISKPDSDSIEQVEQKLFLELWI